MAISNESLSPVIHNKEEFLEKIERHPEKISENVSRLMIENFSLLQRLFGPKKLIKVIDDQKVQETKSEFDFRNRVLELSHEIHIDALKQKYSALLMGYESTIKDRLIRHLDNLLSKLLIDLQKSRHSFTDSISDQIDMADKFKTKPEVYQTLKDSIYKSHERYFKIIEQLINAFENDISLNIEKYRKDKR